MKGYLFDRRQVGRILRAEWGMPCNEEEYVTCVRRFGRPDGSSEGHNIDHITGARMAQTNGHEVSPVLFFLVVFLTAIFLPLASSESVGLGVPYESH